MHTCFSFSHASSLSFHFGSSKRARSPGGRTSLALSSSSSDYTERRGRRERERREREREREEREGWMENIKVQVVDICTLKPNIRIPAELRNSTIQVFGSVLKEMAINHPQKDMPLPPQTWSTNATWEETLCLPHHLVCTCSSCVRLGLILGHFATLQKIFFFFRFNKA